MMACACAIFAGHSERASAQTVAKREPSARVSVDTIPGSLVSLPMVLVPEGTVTVPGQSGPERVTVAPFWIGRTELPWEAYDAFALSRDSVSSGGGDATARPSRPYGAPDYGWGHHGFPTMSVAREAAEAFCAWLSTRTGRRYRLPTEAEWVHAAILGAGAATLAATQQEDLAWHVANASERTHGIATKRADRLGLHDMFGNVAEWVVTRDGRRVVRGGSFRDPMGEVGPGARAVQDESWNERDPQIPKSRWWLSDAPFVGFRIVREP
jgi:formylglycine-generating enzyme required for sulfatase activity